ncbi:hypothetical protein [Streptomyces tritici]|uniref:hypothetical protein n=1 Tax=Streptomyces tritici TaxID=2054410 RepID=UPI003AF10B2D
MTRSPRAAALLLVLAALAASLLPAGTAAAAAAPKVTLSQQEAGAGGELVVGGTGWKPGALLMLLICGQSTPAAGLTGGTNSCANADGRAATADAKGAFRQKLPVAEPPVPCPCVVHVAGVTGGEQASVDVAFTVAGHPTEPLPARTGGGRLAVLAAVRLEGSSGVLVWFGAPAQRRIVFTVGNLGSGPVRDPVFQVGTAHGVFAPQYEERQWRGTVAPGRKALVELPVELPAGAHGDYRVTVKYGDRVLVEQPWGVGRPWGVVVFWVLLAVVVPTALFRAGMAVVDRARPARAARHRATEAVAPEPTALPWFTPDSAPSENPSTTKGHA